MPPRSIPITGGFSPLKVIGGGSKIGRSSNQQLPRACGSITVAVGNSSTAACPGGSCLATIFILPVLAPIANGSAALSRAVLAAHHPLQRPDRRDLPMCLGRP